MRFRSIQILLLFIVANSGTDGEEGDTDRPSNYLLPMSSVKYFMEIYCNFKFFPRQIFVFLRIKRKEMDSFNEPHLIFSDEIKKREIKKDKKGLSRNGFNL